MNQYADPYFMRLVVSRIGKGELLLDDPASVPMGLYEELDKLWLSLPCEFDFMAHRMLGILSLLREPCSDEMMYRICRTYATYPETAVDFVPEDIPRLRASFSKWLMFSGDRYTLLHDRLRCFIAGEIFMLDPKAVALERRNGEFNPAAGKLSARDLHDLHMGIADFYDPRDDQDERDGLNDAGAGKGAYTWCSYHLQQAGVLHTLFFPDDQSPAGQRLYGLCRDPRWKQGSIRENRGYTLYIGDLQRGLQLFAMSAGDGTDGQLLRLFRLALDADRCAAEAAGDVHRAFEIMEQDPMGGGTRVEDAVEIIMLQDEETFFRAALLLLWIELDRLDEPGMRDSYATSSLEAARRIIDAVKRRLPESPDPLNWPDVVPAALLEHLSVRLLEQWPELDIIPLLRPTAAIHHLLERFSKRIESVGTETAEAIIRCMQGLYEAEYGEDAQVEINPGRIGGLDHIASAHLSAGHEEKARSMCTRASQLIDRLEEPYERCEALLRAAGGCTAALDPQYAAGLFDTASQLLGEIEDEELEANIQRDLSLGLLKFGWKDRACAIAEAMEFPLTKAEAFLNIAVQLREAGDSERAEKAVRTGLAIAEQLENDEYFPERSHTFGKYVGYFNAEGRFGEGLRLAESMEDPMNRAAAIGSIAAALSARGDGVDNDAAAGGASSLDAEALFARAESLIDDIDQKYERRDALERILGSTLDHGDFSRARHFAGKIRDEYPDDTASFDRFTEAHLSQGLISRAREDYRRSFSSGDEPGSEPQFSTETLLGIAEKTAELGCSEEARRFLSRIDEDHDFIDHEDETAFWRRRARLEGKFGNAGVCAQYCRKALEAAGKIGKGFIRGPALYDAARSCIGPGCGSAIEAARADAEQPFDRAFLLLGSVAGHADSGDTARARTTLEDTLRVSELVNDPDDVSILRWRLAREYASLGELEKARGTAEKIAGSMWRSAAWSDIAAAHAERNEYEAARAAIDAIEDEISTVDALGQVATILTARGREKDGREKEARKMFDRAIAAASTVSDEYRRAIAQEVLTEHLTSAGHIGETERTIGEIDNWHHHRKALKRFAKECAHAGREDALFSFLYRSSLSAAELGEVLPDMLESVFLYSEKPASQLTTFMLFLPILPAVLPHGLLYLLSSLITENEKEIARKIILECPEFSWIEEHM